MGMSRALWPDWAPEVFEHIPLEDVSHFDRRFLQVRRHRQRRHMPFVIVVGQPIRVTDVDLHPRTQPGRQREVPHESGEGCFVDPLDRFYTLLHGLQAATPRRPHVPMSCG